MGCAGGKMDRKCRKSNIYNLLLQELSLFMFQCESYRIAVEPSVLWPVIFLLWLNWVASLQAKHLFEDDGFIVAAFVLSSLGMLVSGIIIRSGVAATVSRSNKLENEKRYRMYTFEISNAGTVGFYMVLCFFNVRLLGEWQNPGFPRPWA